jgi:hypothetical protein
VFVTVAPKATELLNPPLLALFPIAIDEAAFETALDPIAIVLLLLAAAPLPMAIGFVPVLELLLVPIAIALLELAVVLLPRAILPTAEEFDSEPTAIL